MENLGHQLVETDLHRLEPRFASLRVAQPKVVETLARSVAQSGQLVPVVAVGHDAQPWVLVDGYRRIEALRRCGKDTVWVERWDCEIAQALLAVLARAQARPWEVIEEAGLLHELHTRFGHSQRQLAHQVGRDVSWVNRRLALIDTLSDELLAAVCQGQVSSWAALRILTPLARANTDHAHALLQSLVREPLTARELTSWFQHYQRANRQTREHMLERPALFLKARSAQQAQHQAQQLQDGPEGAWRKDLQVLGHLLKRLRERLCSVFTPAQSRLDRRQLLTAFADAKALFTQLEQDLERLPPDDCDRNTSSHSGVACQEHAAARDQPPA